MSNFFTPAYFNINTGKLVERNTVNEVPKKGEFRNILVQDMRLSRKRRELKRQFIEEARDLRASWYIDLMHNLQMPPDKLSLFLIQHFTPTIVNVQGVKLAWKEFLLTKKYPEQYNQKKVIRFSYDI